jgi:hypothetical protein
MRTEKRDAGKQALVNESVSTEPCKTETEIYLAVNDKLTRFVLTRLPRLAPPRFSTTRISPAIWFQQNLSLNLSIAIATHLSPTPETNSATLRQRRNTTFTDLHTLLDTSLP